MEERIDYGTELRVWRVRARLSQEELADKLGIYRGTLSEVENGKMPLSKQVFEEWMKRLERS